MKRGSHTNSLTHCCCLLSPHSSVPLPCLRQSEELSLSPWLRKKINSFFNKCGLRHIKVPGLCGHWSASAQPPASGLAEPDVCCRDPRCNGQCCEAETVQSHVSFLAMMKSSTELQYQVFETVKQVQCFIVLYNLPFFPILLQLLAICQELSPVMLLQAQSVEPGLSGSGSGSSSEEEGENTGLDTTKPLPKTKNMPVLVKEEENRVSSVSQGRVKQCENTVPPSSSSPYNNNNNNNNVETQTWPPLIASSPPGPATSSHTSKVCRARAVRSNNGPTPRKRPYSQSHPATGHPRSPLRPVPVGPRGDLKNKRQPGPKKRLAAAAAPPPVYIPS